MLFVVTEDWYFVSHRLRFARWLGENGCHVAVACRVGNDREKIDSAGIKVISVDIGRKGMGPVTCLRQVMDLGKALRYFRPDLIHAVALRAILVTRFARLLACPRRPLVNAVAGMGGLFAGELRSVKHRAARRGLGCMLRWLLKGPAVRTVFQNRDDLQLALDEKWCRKDQAEIIPGVGISVPEDSECDEDESREASAPVRILFAGRLLRDKGVAILLQASKQLHERGVAHELEIIGEGDEANPNSLKREDLAEWQQCSWIAFKGRRDDVPTRMRQAHIVAHPTYYREGIPKVLLEAGAAAKPVVTCDVPGCRDLVVEGRTGLLVPPRDVGALADALEKLAINAEWSTRMGLENLQRVREHYSENKIFPSFASCYAVILDGTTGD